jgi:hypothetical protein
VGREQQAAGKVMREEAEITERLGEERIRQRILTGTKQLSERRLAGGPSTEIGQQRLGDGAPEMDATGLRVSHVLRAIVSALDASGNDACSTASNHTVDQLDEGGATRRGRLRCPHCWRTAARPASVRQAFRSSIDRWG